MAHRPLLAAALAAGLLLPLAACSSDDEAVASDSGDESTTTAESVTTEATTADAATDDVLTIMVTNDDGVGAEGIDTLVESLIELPDTEVVVVAPAENQSGTGGQTTDGEPVVTETTTASGHEATSVDGFPADSVVWAFEGGIPATPDLVVSGVNSGQNIGPFVELSGTVGAAREAASRGVPALAVSSGLGDPVDFEAAAELAIEWIEEHRAELVAGAAEGAGGEDAEDVEVWNLNVPTCPTGEVREVVEVPVATDLAGRDINAVDCASTATDPADDVGAFLVGFATLTEVSPAG